MLVTIICCCESAALSPNQPQSMTIDFSRLAMIDGCHSSAAQRPYWLTHSITRRRAMVRDWLPPNSRISRSQLNVPALRHVSQRGGCRRQEAGTGCNTAPEIGRKPVLRRWRGDFTEPPAKQHGAADQPLVPRQCPVIRHELSLLNSPETGDKETIITLNDIILQFKRIGHQSYRMGCCAGMASEAADFMITDGQGFQPRRRRGCDRLTFGLEDRAGGKNRHRRVSALLPPLSADRVAAH